MTTNTDIRLTVCECVIWYFNFVFTASKTQGTYERCTQPRPTDGEEDGRG